MYPKSHIVHAGNIYPCKRGSLLFPTCCPSSHHCSCRCHFPWVRDGLGGGRRGNCTVEGQSSLLNMTSSPTDSRWVSIRILWSWHLLLLESFSWVLGEQVPIQEICTASWTDFLLQTTARLTSYQASFLASRIAEWTTVLHFLIDQGTCTWFAWPFMEWLHS